MVAAVKLWPQPPFHPNVCIRCGCGTGQRDYFIDLQVPLMAHFNPYLDGAIYFCNECIPGLIADINTEVTIWNQNHAPWQSPDRVEASYDWQKEIDLSGIERLNSSSSGLEQSSTRSSVDTIEDSGDSESADAVPESTVLTVYSDAESGSNSGDKFGLDFG